MSTKQWYLFYFQWTIWRYIQVRWMTVACVTLALPLFWGWLNLHDACVNLSPSLLGVPHQPLNKHATKWRLLQWRGQVYAFLQWLFLADFCSDGWAPQTLVSTVRRQTSKRGGVTWWLKVWVLEPGCKFPFQPYGWICGRRQVFSLVILNFLSVKWK